MATGRRSRLFRGLSASGYAQAISLLLQLAMVPVLLAVWGTSGYADWVLVATLPGLLAMSDAGLAAVSGNRMALDWAAGRHQDYRRLACATLRFQSLLLGLVLTLLIVTAWLLPWRDLLNLQTLDDASAGRCILALGAATLVGMWAGVFGALLRAEDRYATSLFWRHSERLAEGIACCMAAALGSGLLDAALAMLGIRLVSATALVLVCRRWLGWLPEARLGRWSDLRPLLSAALAQLSLPLSFALSLNGMVIALSHLLGAEGAAAFNAMRVLSRTIAQIPSAIGHGLVSELTHSVGAGLHDQAKALIRRALYLALAIDAALVAILLPAGERLFNLWTGGGLAFTWAMWPALLLSAACFSLWNLAITLPVVINRHIGLAMAFAGLSVATPFAAYTLGSVTGVWAAVLVPAAADALMLTAVLRWLARFRNEGAGAPA